MYKLALQIATKAHKGQVRKDGITPYIKHPIRVADKFNDDFKKTIAILHDVLEDTDQDLSMFPQEVLSVLDVLTKKDNYFTYIDNISKNDIAREIKIADIEDNLSDTCFQLSPSQIKRYNKALKYLYEHKKKNL